ncbi:hypothetical protein HK098_008101 [Nowakowskiella sp. JEL0407]|nr:hypothetical protein HK098_008101 [Nowakowskiella sp. JEL0407]
MLPKFITGQHLRAIADVKPNLQRLVLANCSTLEDADVMDIVMATASTLVSIDLSNCRKITSSTVEVIAFFCGPWKKLESVRLKNCSLVSDNALTLLAENIGECLKVLDLSGCRRITDAGVAMFLRKSYRRTMALRKSSLKTPNAQITVSDPNERDDFDEKVVQFQHHRVPSDRTDEKKLLVDPATQGRLTEFRISGSWIFTRGGFLSIMDYLIKMHRNLEVLEFSIPNPPKGAPIPEFVDFPVSLFGNLRSFHINRAKYLNDASLRSLIDVLNNKDARLTQLSINGRALTSHSVFNYLMTHLNNLTFLSLRNSALTDADVEHLVSSQFFPILQVLDLSGCSTLTTAALLEIGKFSQSFVLISIGNAIMELKQLVGTRNGVLTVEEFTPITFQRLHLTKLDVSKCKRISFKGVELLVKYCAYPYGCLKYLDVTECGVDIKDQVDSMLMMEIEGENLEEEHEILELHIPEYVGADTEENPRLGVVLTGKRLEAVAKRCRI